jgi:acetyl esterase/lipase
MHQLKHLLLVAMSLTAGWVAGGDVIEPKGATQPEPTHADVKYGPHERNVLDFWAASGDKPAALFLYFHSGGFLEGDKKNISIDIKSFTKRGIAVASANYRYSTQAIYPAPMMDAARALQFIRSKAKEWNIDPKRVAVAGVSAGAGISLWLGFHDDLADPKADDPVLRESTRVTCAISINGQCSYDPRFIKQNIPGLGWQHSALYALFGIQKENLDSLSPEKSKLIDEGSPITFLTADDPPVYVGYTSENKDLPADGDMGKSIHHPKFGEILKKRMDELKIECVFLCKPDHSPMKMMDFALKHLKQ